MANKPLVVKIAGDATGASKALAQVGRDADGMGAKVGRIAKTVAAVGATAALAVGAFAVSSVQAAAEVDTGLREVNTLFGRTGDAADEAFGRLQSGVAGLSREVGVAQAELTGGLYQAISAGVPEDNVFEFMEVAAKAAIGGVTTTEVAIDGLTTTINAFGLDVADAEAVADSMFTTVKGGKTTFEELSGSLFNVAPAAAAAGVEFTEVNAALATLTASGTPTSVATTQLRAALTGLQKPSKDLDKIFQDLGHENAQLAIESEGLGFALDAVKDASDGNNGELQRLLGSVEAVAAANVIAGTGADKFADELVAQAEAAGASTDAFTEMEKSTGRQLERLKVGIGNIGVAVGSALLPHLNSVIQWAVDRLPAMQDTFDRVLGALGTIFREHVAPAADVAVAAFRGVSDWWTNNSETISGAASGLGEVLAGIGSAASGMWETAGEALDALKTWWAEHGPAITAAADDVREHVEGAIGGIADTIGEIAGLVNEGDWSGLGDRIAQAVIDAVRALAGLGAELYGVIVGWLGEVDWVSMGIELGEKAIPLAVGLVTGLLNAVMDLDMWWDIISNHWQEIGLAALGVAFAPGKWIAKIAQVLRRIPFVGRLVAWAIEALNGLGSTILRGAGAAVKSLSRGFLDGLGLQTSRILAGLFGLRGRITRWIRDAAVMLGVKALEIAESIGRTLASAGPRQVVRGIRAIREAIGRVVSGAGRWLLSAGRKLIDGFVEGIKAKFDSVRRTLRSLTDKLTSWKGPPERDAKLLHRAGQLVIGGFVDGIRSQEDAVRDALGRLTDVVGATVIPAPEFTGDALGDVVGAAVVPAPEFAGDAVGLLEQVPTRQTRRFADVETSLRARTAGRAGDPAAAATTQDLRDLVAAVKADVGGRSSTRSFGPITVRADDPMTMARRLEERDQLTALTGVPQR